MVRITRWLDKISLLESNPGINIQKAPSCVNCKHCGTAPETVIIQIRHCWENKYLLNYRTLSWFYLNENEG